MFQDSKDKNSIAKKSNTIVNFLSKNDFVSKGFEMRLRTTLNLLLEVVTFI